jgi:hypothetical protein
MDEYAQPSCLELEHLTEVSQRFKANQLPPYDAANDPFHTDWPYW